MKCEILCALLQRPKVLFLDEPTIGLDLISKDQVRQAIREVNSELGTTVILTSHDLSDVSSLCRNISLLDRGRFLYRGGVEGLLEAHSSRKMIRVKLERPVAQCRLNGFPLVQTGEFTAVLEHSAEGAPLSSLLAQLFKELPIADVSVESAGLEQVVKSLYRAGKAASA
jgi:ABC-2 type transport system ATP-binding protein